MDTILYMTKVFLSSVFLSLLPTDVARDNFFILLMSVNCIGIYFWPNGAGH